MCGRTCRLQELHAVHHLFRAEDLGNQHRASDEGSNRRTRRHQQNACVRSTSSVQTQMIGVRGDQDPAVGPREGEERRIRRSELSRFGGGYGIDPACT